ncbi:MAG: two-component system sensor histidine kinase CreC [Gammaproteobacteria bacterium]|nr:two-component system sensor histidine kinase CreC [Gammaproteobacteria bacterium]
MRYLKKLIGSFSFRLYLMYFLMVGGAAWFIASRSLQAVDVSVSQAAEEVLVDTANLLAEQLSHELKDGKINVERLRENVPNYLQRRFHAKIYENVKTRPDLQLYVTDDKGIVIFDSTGLATGQDFSRWKDVKRTLSGEYGARASPLDYRVETAEEAEKGLFVSAPIVAEDKVIGVLTVIKGRIYLGDYVLNTNHKIKWYALAVLSVSLFTGAFISWWLWRSIKKLSRYAKQLGQGNHVAQPKIIHSEFKPLANAMESMYEDLEGKEYVENYVHTLAHELKSPLTGMIATTELLQQNNMPADTQQQFIGNLHDSAQRMTALIERLLQLASVENRHQLAQVKSVNIADCVNELLQDFQSRMTDKGVKLECDIPTGLSVIGEPTLIRGCISNLVDNAIDFTHDNTTVKIIAKVVESDTDKHNTDSHIVIEIIDSGDGIADFAKPRLFERFFSTPRPHSQQRSSGLGLAFVKESMALHGGKVVLENHTAGGAVARLIFPLKK